MSPKISAKHIPESAEIFSDFISLPVAITLVTYSRDYIGRLAREGKIVSKQIDKQWFVSRVSLLNFYETSALEDSVKKRILSVSRKNDLEVKDFYTNAITSIANKQQASAVSSAFLTLLVVCGGLLSGIFINKETAVFSTTSDIHIAQLMASLQFGTQQASSILADDDSGFFTDSVTLESQDKIPMADGVVLFPALGAGDTEVVDTLFSDEVTVVITGTSTGFIRAKDSDTELPFVRIPQTSP
jgi:hypothetical protein